MFNVHVRMQVSMRACMYTHMHSSTAHPIPSLRFKAHAPTYEHSSHTFMPIHTRLKPKKKQNQHQTHNQRTHTMHIYTHTHTHARAHTYTYISK